MLVTHDPFRKSSKLSFDHLAGAGLQRQRHGQAERLGSLKVDHQLEFGRRLNRQIAWLFAPKDAIDI